MKLGARHWAGILFFVLVSAFCWLDLAASGTDRSPPGPRVPAAWREVPPSLPSVRGAVRLPSPILGLAAMTADARTSLLGMRFGGILPLTGPVVMDGRSTVLRGSGLAFLVLPGIDPSQNYLEAHSLADDLSWKILPDDGGVIFGFAMDPSGGQLAYLEVDSRPSGTQPPWRVVVVDLASGSRHTILESSRDGIYALQPIDWMSGTILLRGLTPFSPHFHGLWTVLADGSNLRNLLDESDYVGTPQLSPQGDRLALLRAEPGVRPPLSVPGEPTATVVEVLDLAASRRTIVLAGDSEHEFTDLRWEAGGLLVVQGEWNGEQSAFVHRQVLRLAPDAGSSPEVLVSVVDGDIVDLAPCPNEGWLAAVRAGSATHVLQGNGAEPIASFHHGTLEYLTCLASSASDSTRAMPRWPMSFARVEAGG